MRLFVLPHAHVSHLPPRAEGVVFTDGTVALRPLDRRATHLYEDVTALEEDWGRVCLEADLTTIMQRFHLVRAADATGNSGTGTVAEGVILSNGAAVMHWLREPYTTTMYRHVDEVLRLHGHGGCTRVVVLDQPVPVAAAGD